MKRPKTDRIIRLAIVLTCVAAGVSVLPASADEHARVRFDIPDKIECRDVTPEKCAAAHPTLKVVEVKFRISASFLEGSESSVVDFDYMISSPAMRLKVLDYLPNTTLESTYADDHIEVADLTESTESNTGEAKVAYSLLSFSATKNKTAKKSEQNHYKRLAPKSLVLASGTINRGHGVFFKLRPSNGASLEGAKEFSVLAVVPKEWRGDWCSFVCAARTKKKSLVSSSVVLAGIDQAHVGLYLVGDHEASAMSAKLCQLQQANQGVLAKQLAQEAAEALEAMHATSAASHSSLSHFDDWLSQITRLKTDSKPSDSGLTQARQAVLDIEQRLGELASDEK